MVGEKRLQILGDGRRFKVTHDVDSKEKGSRIGSELGAKHFMNLGQFRGNLVFLTREFETEFF